ncbi:MAG: methionyl-tRNA formyltransferase [Candidatus Nomurabacteria bacterium]|jgi:methionyl-tRNA formyltransferase|nr:methionyl-tRNA formyltransferase [Candidatus Nomurabacteria bacterium]
MKKISNPIIYFGTDKLSAQPLTRLLEAGFPVEAVVTKPDTIKGRGRQMVAPDVKVIGEEYGIKVLQPSKLSEITPFLSQLNRPLGVLVSFGKIVPQDIIDLFPKGIINIHPSLLPKYRGPSPIETVILNGDSSTGATLMKLTAKMDAGPVFAQKEIALSGSETKNELYERLACLGSDMLINHLPDIADGSLQAEPQDDTKATYCQKLDKSMASLDVVKNTTTWLLRQIRAFAGFPKSKLELLGLDCTITAAHTASHPGSALDQKCKDGLYLIIDRLVPPGSNEMTAQDFLNGHSTSG